MTWDEPHFVENARNLLHHRSDWNDHPPLGKLLIAVGMMVAGDNSTGWRLVPLVFGIALIALAYLLTAAVFRSGMAGLFGAAFVVVVALVFVYCVPVWSKIPFPADSLRHFLFFPYRH